MSRIESLNPNRLDRLYSMGKYRKGIKKYHKGCRGEVEVIAQSTPTPKIGYWCKKCESTIEREDVTEKL